MSDIIITMEEIDKRDPIFTRDSLPLSGTLQLSDGR